MGNHRIGMDVTPMMQLLLSQKKTYRNNSFNRTQSTKLNVW